MCGPHVMQQIDYGESDKRRLGDDHPYVRRTGEEGAVQVAGEPEPKKRSMIGQAVSRRNLFRLSGVTGVAAAVSVLPTGVVAHADAQGLLRRKVKDLTHTLSADFPIFYPLSPPPVYEQRRFLETDGFNAYVMTLDEHSGTHIDAPAHFSNESGFLDEIPVQSLVAPLVVIRIGDRAENDASARLELSDIRRYERRYGRIPKGAFVAMDSGWSKRVDIPGAYLNQGPDGVFRWPGIDPEATAFLVEERSIVGAGVDSTSLDAGGSDNPDTHQILLPAGLYGIENLNNLGSVPASGATIVVGASKHRGGFGGPARVFAFH
ncbi:cyclase family protein [Marinitenerispora sediminis]|uniref:Cyclase n=1 Tax=Marinitenerispora sediminis TaxID=1931232 RepID=A0A368T587_9ACTN|nr:cyclase family protein [Marinitenerispora sediminis]RCV50133.1 cyclase [Marinitenerispora sediminis]RCV54550.1 cyclase [Marinitenerispora sediminis]RCV58793.1 cyclase [Marinitenerispora sediminis]